MAVLNAPCFSRDVTLVEPLHDDDDRRPLIVETVGHRFAEDSHNLLALQVALRLDDVVGIVEDDPVAALAGGRRKTQLIDDVKYWRDRAEEVRTEAEFTLQPITRTALFETAEGYEALASRIEQRLGEVGRPKSSETAVPAPSAAR